MTDIFNMEKEFEELMKKGQELIEKLKKEKSKKVERWKPAFKEGYFYITPNLKVKKELYEEQFDEDCWSAGNCFKTKEEAQKELDRRITEQELLDMCDWEDGACAEIMYDLEYKEFSVGFPCTENCYSPYRFASKESCKRAIDTLGEDKLKLVFRIED